MSEIISLVSKRIANVIKEPDQISMIILYFFKIYFILRKSLRVKMIQSYIELLLKITTFSLTNFRYIANCLIHHISDVIEA